MSHLRKLIHSGNELVDFEQIRSDNNRIRKQENPWWSLPVFDVDYYLDVYMKKYPAHILYGILTLSHHRLSVFYEYDGSWHCCLGDRFVSMRENIVLTRKQLKQIALDWYVYL